MSDSKHSTPQSRHLFIVQAIKYAVLSMSAAGVQLLSFTLFNLPLRFPYWLASACAIILSVVWNATINRKVTFKSDVNLPLAILKATLFYAVFIPASSLIGQLLVNADWNAFIVQGLTMLANGILEFLYWKFYVFRKPTASVANKADRVGEADCSMPPIKHNIFGK